jgi:hypothetical protein
MLKAAPAHNIALTRAETPPNPSRRGMLAAAASALVAGAGAATMAHAAPSHADGADAELIALLATLEAQETRVRSIVDEAKCLPDGITPASRAQERRLEEAMDEWWNTAEAIFEIPLTTPPAIRIKAQALQMVLLDLLRPGCPGYVDPGEHGDQRLRLAWTFACDAAGGRVSV